MGLPKVLQLTPRKAYVLVGLILLGFIALAYCIVADAAPATPVVTPGSPDTYARGSLPRTGRWLGLFCSEEDCVLRATRVSVASSEHENVVGDMEETEELAVLDNPVALFHGTRLEAGPVTAWTGIAPSGRAFGGTQVMGRWMAPGRNDAVELSWSELPGGEGYRYHLGQNGKRQKLFDTAGQTHDGEDVAPTIHWVGDLDGDGKADLLMSIAGETSSFDMRLYLSSRAGKGQLVGEAARFAGNTPACGY